MGLSEHQEKAWNVIEEGFNEGDVTLLSGSAGTGKSFMIAYIIDYINKLKKSVIVCTPTHKSLKVVSDFIADAKLQTTTSTIHSFLRIKEQIDNTGRSFVPDKNASPPDYYDYLIIDECSMLSDDLIDYIIDANQYYSHILFVGDSAQLPPVDTTDLDDDEEHSIIPPVFNLPIKHTANLTEIVRQAQDNPIIKDATIIRDCIFSETYVDYINDLFCNCNKFSSERSFIVEYAKEMQRENDIVLGTYTNRNVDFFNTGFRYIDHKSAGELPNIMKGETIVANTALAKEGTILVSNNSEVHINEAEVGLDDNRYKVYFCNVKIDDRTLDLKIIHEDHAERLQRQLEMFKDQALSAYSVQRSGAKLDKPPYYFWRRMYDLKGQFLEYKYKYSCTLHKLQGSTVDTVFLDFRDLPWRDKNLMYRLMYVGLTRAANTVNVLL